jgi:predicted TIM-barrel fold metal-dependent hydrolase
MRIIDTHAHIFPQNVFEKIWTYFDEHHWPIRYRDEEAKRAAFLDANTARYTTLCYAHKAGMAAWLNDYVLAYAQAHPKAIPTGTFHPADEDVVSYVEAGIKRGFRGFKMHLEVQKFDPSDKRLEPVYDLLTEAEMVVTVHTSGHPLPGPWTGIEPFKRFLAMAPRMKIIVAHMAGPEFAEYLQFVDDYPMYYDTAMVGVNAPPFGPISEEMQALVRKHAGRLVFGSDFPSIPYEWKLQVEAVRTWGLRPEQEDAVFFKNAENLYRL